VQRSVTLELLASFTVLLADYKVPESLEVVQEIPRNHLGKIDYNSLLALISGRGEQRHNQLASARWPPLASRTIRPVTSTPHRLALSNDTSIPA
jgi:hypothetical protein